MRRGEPSIVHHVPCDVVVVHEGTRGEAVNREIWPIPMPHLQLFFYLMGLLQYSLSAALIVSAVPRMVCSVQVVQARS